MISRRFFTIAALGSGLSACVGGVSGGGGGASPSAPPRIVANPAFDAWLAGFRDRAAARGISASTMNAAFRHAGYIPEVIEKDRNQTEFSRTTEDYLNIAMSDERVSMGRQRYAALRPVLSAIESRYGVEGHVITAFWGLESFYGTRQGNVPVVSALATLAFDGRRGAFFEQQLTAALRILQAGDIAPDRMTGSWAGAMGHTQFIPTSFLEYAVDFTSDGHRDIWSSDPTDALASTANYMKRAGWVHGLPWGMEVILPAGFDAGLLGRGKGRSAADWSGLGVRAAQGGGLQSGSIIAPMGLASPAFLLTQNFNAILRYNNAENYALGVGTLSDRIRGGGPLVGTFGPDKAGMTKADRQELQERLTAAGYDTGGHDGVIGAKTKSAISAYQGARGLAVTGEPSLDLLAMLR